MRPSRSGPLPINDLNLYHDVFGDSLTIAEAACRITSVVADGVPAEATPSRHGWALWDSNPQPTD